MISPTIMEVNLFVPEWVRDGLIRGDYKAFGGTIRDLAGRTVALLTEGQGLTKLVQETGSIDPKVLMDAIGHAQTAMQLANGLGALNLVVSSVGFAMIRQRLRQIAGQVRVLTVGMQELKEEAGFIGGLQLATIRGEIDAALNLAMRGQQQGRLQTFLDAKAKAFEVRRKIHHTMTMMLNTRRALPRHEVFGELAQSSVLLAIAEARCDEAVDGPEIAREALGYARRDLGDLLARFATQKQDFASDPKTMLGLGSEGRRAITSLQAGLLTMEHQLDGIAGRLTVQASAGLNSEAWQAMTAPPGSGAVTCVVVSEDAGTDNLQRTHNQTG